MSQAAYNFDSLQFVHDLENAGIKRRQAEAEAKAISNVFARYLENMASKADLHFLETRLSNKIKMQSVLTQHQIKSLRKDMGSEFQSVRKDMGSEFQSVRKDMGSEFQSVRKDMGTEFQSVRKDMENGFQSLRKDMENGFQSVRTEFEEKFKALCTSNKTLGLRLMVSLGSMMCAAVGVLAFLLERGHP